LTRPEFQQITTAIHTVQHTLAINLRLISCNHHELSLRNGAMHTAPDSDCFDEGRLTNEAVVGKPPLTLFPVSPRVWEWPLRFGPPARQPCDVPNYLLCRSCRSTLRLIPFIVCTEGRAKIGCFLIYIARHMVGESKSNMAARTGWSIAIFWIGMRLLRAKRLVKVTEESDISYRPPSHGTPTCLWSNLPSCTPTIAAILGVSNLILEHMVIFSAVLEADSESSWSWGWSLPNVQVVIRGRWYTNVSCPGAQKPRGIARLKSFI